MHLCGVPDMKCDDSVRRGQGHEHDLWPPARTWHEWTSCCLGVERVCQGWIRHRVDRRGKSRQQHRRAGATRQPPLLGL